VLQAHRSINVNDYQNALLDAVHCYRGLSKKFTEHDKVDIQVLSELISLPKQTSLELRENIKARLQMRRARSRSWLKWLHRDKLNDAIKKVNKNKQFSLHGLLKYDQIAKDLLYQQLDDLQTECKNLRREQAGLVVEIQQLEADAEMAAGQSVVNKLYEAEDEILTKQELIETLQHDIQHCDEIIEQCQQELERARQERDQSNLSVKQLFKDSQVQDKKITELEHKNQQLKVTIDTLVVEMREVQQSQHLLSRSAPT